MSHENFQYDMKSGDLMVHFLRAGDQTPAPTVNNFVQYNVSLPLGRDAQEDMHNIKTLLLLVEAQGLKDTSVVTGTQILNPDPRPSQRGEFSCQYAHRREHHEQSARKYATVNNLDENMSLEDYTAHSGRPLVLSLQISLHPDDLPRVQAAFAQNHAPQAEAELSVS